jgi:hypothetical protein
VVVVSVVQAYAAALLALAACSSFAAPLTAQMRVTALVVPSCSQLAIAQVSRDGTAAARDLVVVSCGQSVRYTLTVLRPAAPAASVHSAAVDPSPSAGLVQATLVQIDF